MHCLHLLLPWEKKWGSPYQSSCCHPVPSAECLMPQAVSWLPRTSPSLPHQSWALYNCFPGGPVLAYSNAALWSVPFVYCYSIRWSNTYILAKVLPGNGVLFYSLIHSLLHSPLKMYWMSLLRNACWRTLKTLIWRVSGFCSHYLHGLMRQMYPEQTKCSDRNNPMCGLNGWFLNTVCMGREGFLEEEWSGDFWRTAEEVSQVKGWLEGGIQCFTGVDSVQVHLGAIKGLVCDTHCVNTGTKDDSGQAACIVRCAKQLGIHSNYHGKFQEDFNRRVAW